MSSTPPEPKSSDEQPGSSFEWEQSKRGIWLFSRSWIPQQTEPAAIKGVVFVVHGYAESISRSGAYGNLARRLAAQGYAVCGQDCEGHGRSTGQQAYFPSMRQVVADQLAFVQRKSALFPNKPVFMFGFSMGGLLATATIIRLIQAKFPLRGAVLKAPALFVDPTLATPVKKFLARVFSAFAPRLPVGKGGAHLISRNQKLVHRIQTDPAQYHGGMHARVGAEFLALQADCLAQLRTIDVPVLCLHGAADKLVDPKGAQTVYRETNTSDKTLISYPDSLHDLFEEETPQEEKFLNDVVQWIVAHTN